MAITLGSRVKDTVTGFTGIATARCEYLHSNARVQIEAHTDNKASEAWFEEPRLVEVAAESA
jgi:hypothetical protein